jgi:cytochrome c553
MFVRFAGPGIVALGMCALWTSGCGQGAEPSAPPAAATKTTEVVLCDNHTKVTVDTKENPTREDGEKIAQDLMAQWKLKNPGTDWAAEERKAHTLLPAADNKALVGNPQGQTYAEISDRDTLVWKTQTENFALAGSKVFHSSDELGSTIAVSCDMCHPDAANTHPETYPKFQVQLGRTVLLRDMINWCIEHPVRGTRLAADDPKMRALEAYIYAQRKGVPLDYGRR